MIRRRVVILRRARADLNALFDWIADEASVATALRYLEHVKRYIDGFDLAAERGTRHDDVRPGLRMIGFERRLTILFTTTDTEVRILRVLRAGQDWTSEL